MAIFEIKSDLPVNSQTEIDRISALAVSARTDEEAAFLVSLAPYLDNEVISYDEDGLILQAKGLTTPDSYSGFAKGATFIKIDSTGKAIYENTGTSASAIWNLIGEVTGSDIADGAIGDTQLADTISFNSKVLLLTDGTPVNAVASVGTITVSGTPVADETMVIGAVTYTFKVARAVAGEITISAVNATQVTNIIDAVTLDSTDIVATDGAGDTVVITAATKGVAGNLLPLTESATGIAVNGAGTLGATTAGVNGTVGQKNQVMINASYIYSCIAANTLSGTNWRRISLGSAY